MKVVLINSIFIFLSSAVLTTAALLLAHSDGIFISSDNAAAIANSQDISIGSEGGSDFISFDEVVDRATLVDAEPSISDEPPTTEEAETPETTKEDKLLVSNEPSQNLGDAIVNIVCIQTTNEYKRRISGTGFFISSRGVILTNAHVGQFLLLTGLDSFGETTCGATTGVAGAPTYSVKILYISSAWLIEHASLLSDNDPRGTGENDFALLFVTNEDNSEISSSDFAHLPPATSPVSKDIKNDTVILVGYPKEDGAKTGTRAVTTTTITDLYTFGSGLADIITLDSSPLGYTGASGGPVIDHLGRSIGVITTKETGTTILNAITMAHIDRSIKSETGSNLASILQGDLNQKATLFNKNISPLLQEILIKKNDQ